MKIAYGTWEISVQLLPKYMCGLSKYNTGTTVECKHLRANIEMSKTLNYVFCAFRPCVDGFRRCRKIISVDGTHLYTKYKHKMLIGVTLDANNQVLPLGFAIMDEETTDSWKWFLENLRSQVVRGENGVCLIYDRHKGIVRATEDLPYFQPPYEKWSLAHDGGWHRWVMTTNMSECLNSVLNGARRLPISAIVHLTLMRCVHYFIERMTRGGRMVQKNLMWSDYACRKYEKWARKSSEHRVSKYDVREQTALVAIVGRQSRGQHMQVANLSTSDCSCGKWTLFGIPCSHAICTAK
ncbi:uncharacterized protein LOC142541920 [Primulina tabacum]|uniref:uncharacterized protein LOC142541920 n=1 Tax=Primulina tabacum TaxID=48773 RepID=UPI003F5955E7